MNLPLKLTYSDKLNKLEKQYEALLVRQLSTITSCVYNISNNACFTPFQSSSSERQSHLDSLYDFVSQATQELIWLNEKEEEEVAFDWSDRNSGISKKREYHAVSMSLNSPTACEVLAVFGLLARC